MNFTDDSLKLSIIKNSKSIISPFESQAREPAHSKKEETKISNKKKVSVNSLKYLARNGKPTISKASLKKSFKS
jgi:hypothetical protein